MVQKKYDLILWGASSFVGKITARYLIETYGSNKQIKWAIAGRNKFKLESLATELQQSRRGNLKVDLDCQIDIIIGDGSDIEFLKKMTSQTKVVLTTVGPYMKYGEGLVAACVETGTDYCDLTGEVPFIRQMQDKYTQQAQKTGARIVNCCGADSIPSDLGVYYANQQAKELYHESISSVKCIIKKMKGGVSGGTVASIINIIDSARANKETQKILKNPYALCLAYGRAGIRQPYISSYEYDEKVKIWLTYFIMAAINTRVVFASNCQMGYPYGINFTYCESMKANGFFDAFFKSVSLRLLLLGMVLKPTRWIITKFVLPQPGEGPSLKQQQEGYFIFDFYVKTKNNNFVVQVTGDRDPGYGATAKMFAEAGICMAKDISKQDVSGGFWTPSSAMGAKLIKRLILNAGMTFNLNV